MIGFTSELRPAHKILPDDWFKLGGRLVRVLESIPRGNDEQDLRVYFVDTVREEKVTVCSIVVPRNVELKVFNQCVLPKVSHKNCPVCGKKVNK